jgi:hypothetical protein
MKAGSKITGNTNTAADYGGYMSPRTMDGGVSVYRGGIFEMDGGEISGNTGKNVGGVGVGAGSGGPGAFTMTGGTIGGNTGESAGGVYIGLVGSVGPGGSFTKTGGTIYGKAGNRILDNEAAGESGDKGHAVFWKQDNRRINGDHTGGNLSVTSLSVSPWYTSDSDWDPQVTGVTVSSPKVSAAQGEDVQLSADVVWYRGTSQDVTWQLNGVGSPGTTAGGSSINGAGLLSVGSEESAVSLTVTAVSVDAPWVSGSKVISVTPPAVVRTAAGLYTGDSTTPEDLDGYTSTSGDNLIGKALAYLQANATNDTGYTIVLGENITAPMFDLYPARVNGAQNVGITLEGLDGERTIVRDYTGSTFKLNNITLTLGNNITLEGKASNTSPIVNIITGGKLVMLDGSKITGNTNTSTSNYKGAGVTVDTGGTFEMKGGEISGNTRTAGTRSAGGVYNDGTFIMSGGIICGNTVNSSGNLCAGGVFSLGSTFTKTGGIIYGVNTGRGDYNAADDNSAEGTSGATKANAVLWRDSSKVWQSIDGDFTGDFPTE